MKINKVVLLFTLVISSVVHAQMYGDYHFGVAIRKADYNSPFVSLHIGCQFNNVFDINGIGLIEYDQRALMRGVSPTYLGGRVGYGWNTGEYTSIILFGGTYYRLFSEDNKSDEIKFNYWVPGYGLSFVWKGIILDISKIEVYQVSIGCHYLLD
jgi:hypothetical protein